MRVASTKHPGVHWRPAAALVADFTYDGKPDVALLGFTGEPVAGALWLQDGDCDSFHIFFDGKNALSWWRR